MKNIAEDRLVVGSYLRPSIVIVRPVKTFDMIWIVSLVSGWGVYCYDFPLLPITSYHSLSLRISFYYSPTYDFLLLPYGASCPRADALNTRSSMLPLDNPSAVPTASH